MSKRKLGSSVAVTLANNDDDDVRNEHDEVQRARVVTVGREVVSEREAWTVANGGETWGKRLYENLGQRYKHGDGF
jgi:hypothetical protein